MEAAEVFGPLGGLILSASSGTRDPRARAELGWPPVRSEMLPPIGERRLRSLATTHLKEKSYEDA